MTEDASPSSPSEQRVDHLIIGAGFGGLCAAIELDRDGERDFVVLEKGSDVGGTWRDNTYPGAACDVPSQLYSFSFASHDWPSSYSPQPDIQAYIKDVAYRSGTLDRFRFETPVQDATWMDATQRWTVRTPHGSWSSRTLIVAAGALSEPRMPDIAGLETFQGEVFHTARWRHDADLAGKRVAVIGTGASAIQIVPELARTLRATGGHLDVYQRTAPWIVPRNDRAYSRTERTALERVPGLRRLYRTSLYWTHEAYVPAFTLAPRMAWPAQKVAEGNIARGIEDPELRRRVTPDFQLGCKRVLRSNEWYPTLAQPEVDLVTDPIVKITGSGVVTADGTEREIDVLVVATGFYTTELPITEQLTGRSGRTLAARWRETGMAAYKGTTVPDFPNLFFIVGPNTGQGHTSMVHIIESQVAYLRDALRSMRQRRLATVEPTQQTTDRFNRALQRRMGRTVWTTGGCQSWYLDAHGRNTTLWPRSTFDFRRRLASFDADNYLTTPAHQEVPRMKTLDGKVVVITGAGSGIGRALALDCARRGSLLALSDVDETGLAETVARVRRVGARDVRGDRLDVADRDAFGRYALDVIEHFGRANVIVNNAGVSLNGDFTDLEYADMDWIVGINLWGVVHGTKEFLPHLIASGDGHVVNLSSLFGLISMPSQTMYNATKYAVRGLTESLREEMLIAGHPVGVTAVHPGGIKTGIVRNSRVSAKEDKERTAAFFDEKLAKMTPERAAAIIVKQGILGGKARVLVGVDAHAMHQLGRLLGSRYQDVVARAAPRVLPKHAPVVEGTPLP